MRAGKASCVVFGFAMFCAIGAVLAYGSPPNPTGGHMTRGYNQLFGQGVGFLLGVLGACLNLFGLCLGLVGLSDKWEKDVARIGIILNLLPVVAVAIWVALR